jgi:hypothetical protein
VKNVIAVNKVRTTPNTIIIIPALFIFA